MVTHPHAGLIERMLAVWNGEVYYLAALDMIFAADF